MPPAPNTFVKFIISWSLRSKIEAGVEGPPTFYKKPKLHKSNIPSPANIYKNADISQDKLSNILSIPRSTVQYKKTSLEEQGVIPKFCYVFNNQVIGLLKYFLYLDFYHYKPQFLKKLFAFLVEDGTVSYVIQTFGTCDALLVIDIFEPDELVEFRQKLIRQFSEEIKRIRALNVLRVIESDEFLGWNT